MSAPNQGRQSPSPERQSQKQVDPPANDPNKQGQASSDKEPAEQSQNTLDNLSSNPGEHAQQGDAKDVNKKS